MSTTPSNYDAYSSSRNMDTTSPQSLPTSPPSNAQPSIASQLPPHSSYYNNNANLGSNSVYHTPPTRSDTLPPPIAISSALPDTSHSLRPYALASSASASSSSQQQQHQQQAYQSPQNVAQAQLHGSSQYRTTLPAAASPLSYPSRHQSPQTQMMAPSQSQSSSSGYYANTRGGGGGGLGMMGMGLGDDGGGGGRPMSIDGRSSGMAPPQPPAPPPIQGFRRVRGPEDLSPRYNPQPAERRADPGGNGGFLSVSDLLAGRRPRRRR